jgi:RIO kinase 1
MDRGSRFGQAAAEEAWKAKEADALHALHAAGVRVPTPILFYDGVLLMELVVDAHGQPAPRLVDAHVPRDAAAALYADLRGQAIRMLGCDVIHGDLSPYNVLLGRAGPVVIDFPQVVGAAHNSQAESFFRRDLENLRRFLAAVDPSLRSAAGDAREIWRAYVRRELTPDFVPSGKAPPTPPPHAHGHGRRDRQRSRPHVAPAPGRAEPHAHRQPAAPGRRPPPARGQDRRGAAAPEVIRVARPPLPAHGPAATAPPHRPAATPHAGTAHATGPHRADEARPPGRRRRRRRRP